MFTCVGINSFASFFFASFLEKLIEVIINYKRTLHQIFVHTFIYMKLLRNFKKLYKLSYKNNILTKQQIC